VRANLIFAKQNGIIENNHGKKKQAIKGEATGVTPYTQRIECSAGKNDELTSEISWLFNLGSKFTV